MIVSPVKPKNSFNEEEYGKYITIFKALFLFEEKRGLCMEQPNIIIKWHIYGNETYGVTFLSFKNGEYLNEPLFGETIDSCFDKEKRFVAFPLSLIWHKGGIS